MSPVPPVFVLVRPQMAENIGAAARGMLNFGLDRMRLVAPRDGWPSPRAVAMASGAGRVLDAAAHFDTVAEAVADCHRVYATTARPRGITKEVLTPEAAMAEARALSAAGQRVAVLFGPERAGLENEDLVHAGAIVTVPVDEAFPSLNLAQCALLLAYEWRRQGGTAEAPPVEPAERHEVEHLARHWEERLEAAGFFFPPQKAEGMKLNLRNLWGRLPLTRAEVQTLHGALRQLVRRAGASDPADPVARIPHSARGPDHNSTRQEQAMTKLDVDFVRAQFPAFQETSLRDHAFFENAGGSYTCRYVIWRLHRFYRERKVQPYAPYAASQAGGAEMDQARERLARLLGVANEEVSFGPSTTANTYVLANAVRMWLKGKRAAIVVTDQDHEANSGPWRRLAEEGIEVRVWPIDRDTGHLDPDALEPLLDETVRLVCFPHCSNVVGEVNDVARIARMAHAVGAFTCVDGVSYAPHGLPNVGKLGADIYLFSAYKTYGPHQGIMVIRHRVGDQLPNQGHYFNAATLYKRFTPAGPDHAQVAASAGMADYVDAVYAHHHKAGRDQTGRAEVVHDLFRAHEEALLQPLMDYLAARNDLRVLGPRTARGRAPTVAVALDRPGEEVAAALAPHGIMAGGGDFYAVRPLEAMGVDPATGVLRLSFVHYTSGAEVDRLIRALDQVL